MADQRKTIGRCNQAGCGAADTGICIENLKIEECKHFVVGDPIEDPIEEAPESGGVSDELIQVGPGPTLDIQDADAFLRIHKCSVIALVGLPEAGKTTFLATIYELARRRQFGSLGFAGSETIRGFEERCHLSRAASGLEQPDTKRTSGFSPLTFLHLKLASLQQHTSTHFLISDRSGENFRDATDRPSLCASMPELGRCDCIALLIDGGALADIAERHLQISLARTLFMAVTQEIPVRDGQILQLVLTKWDLLSVSDLRDEGLCAFNELTSELRARAPSGMEITSHCVSCRKNHAAVTYGAGVEAVVNDWIPRRQNREFRSSILVGGDFNDTFETLMWRFAGGNS